MIAHHDDRIPYVEMRRSLLKSARRAHKRSERAGINALSVRERMPTAEDREIVMPNPEFAFAGGAFDLAGGPVVFTCRVPDTYWSLSLFAGNTDNFFAVNDAGAGPPGTPVRLILVPKGTTAGAKAGFRMTVEAEAVEAGETGVVVLVAESPTLFGMALHRVLVQNKKKDGDAAIAFLRHHFALDPLSSNAVQIRSQAPPSAGFGLPARSSPVTPALAAIAAAGAVSTRGSPRRLAALWTKAGLAAAAATVASLQLARRVASVDNGPWRFTPGYGSPDASCFVRAVCAIDALFALRRSEAVYGVATTDSAGRPLRADAAYVLRGRTDLATQCRWWGIVAYDAEHHLIANVEDRYSINNKIVVAEDDDGESWWTSYFCAERPASAPAMGEWLPMGPRRAQRVVLVLRLYCPSTALLRELGTCALPTILPLSGDEAGGGRSRL